MTNNIVYLNLVSAHVRNYNEKLRVHSKLAFSFSLNFS